MSTTTEASSMRVRAWCSVAGAHKRRANTAEGGDDEYLGLCSSDSEENGIALGNAPGAKGTFPTPAPTWHRTSALRMKQHRKACAQEEGEPDLQMLGVQTQNGNANVMAVCHPGISGSLAGQLCTHAEGTCRCEHADKKQPSPRASSTSVI